MVTIDLTTPPAPPASFLDGTARRLALTLPELRLVADLAGGAPLPFDLQPAEGARPLGPRGLHVGRDRRVIGRVQAVGVIEGDGVGGGGARRGARPNDQSDADRCSHSTADQPSEWERHCGSIQFMRRPQLKPTTGDRPCRPAAGSLTFR